MRCRRPRRRDLSLLLRNPSFKLVLPKLQWAYKSPSDLVKLQILVQEVWGGSA